MNATWSGGGDLDLSLVDRRGNRISWMGGRRNVVGENAGTTSSERLGLRWTAPGSYLIEVARAESDKPVSGHVDVRILGERRRIPFALQGNRAVVGRVIVRRESRLVPVR